MLRVAEREWITFTFELLNECKHSARLSVSKLRAHLVDTFPLLKVKDELRRERALWFKTDRHHVPGAESAHREYRGVV
jgi:hypothetical protein